MCTGARLQETARRSVAHVSRFTSRLLWMEGFVSRNIRSSLRKLRFMCAFEILLFFSSCYVLYLDLGYRSRPTILSSSLHLSSTDESYRTWVVTHVRDVKKSLGQRLAYSAALSTASTAHVIRDLIPYSLWSRARSNPVLALIPCSLWSRARCDPVLALILCSL